MKVLGNLVWILTVGIWSALAYFFVGVVLCVTIIGIPFGTQCFKLASLSLAPFGQDVNSEFGEHPIANLIWLFIVGWELAAFYFIIGVFLCITIIGIPFGKQCFKLGILALFPFGADL